MTITPLPRQIEAALRAAAPTISEALLAVYLPLLIDHMGLHGLIYPRSIAAFLANVAHESGDFRRLVENLNYSADGLLATFPTRVSPEQAKSLARKPEAIANHVYANRLGNGPASSGDGWRYRGRGLIQTTGRENYGVCGKTLAVNLVDSPELLEQAVYALKSALFFWARKGLTAIAEADDFPLVCRRINGGTTGYQDRLTRYKAAYAALTE